MHAKHMADVNKFLKMELVAQFLGKWFWRCDKRVRELSECVSHLFLFCLLAHSFVGWDSVPLILRSSFNILVDDSELSLCLPSTQAVRVTRKIANCFRRYISLATSLEIHSVCICTHTHMKWTFSKNTRAQKNCNRLFVRSLSFQLSSVQSHNCTQSGSIFGLLYMRSETNLCHTWNPFIFSNENHILSSDQMIQFGLGLKYILLRFMNCCVFSGTLRKEGINRQWQLL